MSQKQKISYLLHDIKKKEVTQKYIRKNIYASKDGKKIKVLYYIRKNNRVDRKLYEKIIFSKMIFSNIMLFML